MDDKAKKRIDVLTKFSQVMAAKEELVKAELEYERARDAFLEVMNEAFP